MTGLLAAVDVGGTFIDVVLADPATGRTHITKVLHRRGDQGADILDALQDLAAKMGLNVSGIGNIVIGTTVVTNALLEGRLARTALLTTEGFRDVLEIARMTRASSYDLHKRRPPVVSPRELRVDVPERIDHEGNVLRPLDLAVLDERVEALKGKGVEAIAVSLLYSFVNAENERAIERRLSSLGVPVSLSSDVLPVMREYERANTTALNAATMNVMERFLDGMAPLKRKTKHAFIMGSAGASLTFAEAKRYPVKCAMSGPAGGTVGALNLARQHGLEAVLTLDVGGTSSDVAMLRDGRVEVTNDRSIGGYSIAIASTEIETVGAGGGSIAYLDRAGLLCVGPQSAGSDPGPVCYGRGGSLPTVTDAHLALNRLGVQGILNGKFALDRAAAIDAITKTIARPLGLTWQRAAFGILEIATANIVRAVRSMSVERGHDPRNMALLAFGGAGPLHAVEVARTLDIPKIIVPYHSGVFSAYGLLSADIAYDMQRTWLRELSAIEQPSLDRVVGEMTAEIMARTAEDCLTPAELCTAWSVDMRYCGQSHALTVELRAPTVEGLHESRKAFLDEHFRRYGHASSALPVEILNLRIRVSQHRPAFADNSSSASGCGEAAGSRELWLSADDVVECPVFRRPDLPDGWSVVGPAIIEQFDTVTVVGRRDFVEVLPGSHALAISIRSHATRPQRTQQGE